LGDILFKGGRDRHVRSCLAHHQMLLDTQNKNVCGLGVGISLVFEIIWGHNSCFKGNLYPELSFLSLFIPNVNVSKLANLFHV
jgi:hypothetical protein